MKAHLNALMVNLSNEKMRLANEQTGMGRQMRAVWVAQLEKEVAAERAFLGLLAEIAEAETISDDDLLAELSA